MTKAYLFCFCLCYIYVYIFFFVCYSILAFCIRWNKDTNKWNKQNMARSKWFLKLKSKLKETTFIPKALRLTKSAWTTEEKSKNRSLFSLRSMKIKIIYYLIILAFHKNEQPKAGFSPSKKNYFKCFNESPLKMMKNAFCFILWAFFVLKIFKV